MCLETPPSRGFVYMALQCGTAEVFILSEGKEKRKEQQNIKDSPELEALTPAS